MAHSQKEAALVLGAGFSHVAGLPLTRTLFDDAEPLPRTTSKAMRSAFDGVRSAFVRARMADPGLTAEEWLAQLFVQRHDPSQEKLFQTTWQHAIRYALARVVTLPKGSKAHFFYGIGTYNCHVIHRRFWERIERDFKVKYIVTTNYDILVEQALHSNPSPHRTAPRCRYGGFPYVLTVRKMTDLTTRAHESLELGKDFVLYKLHGSVNWAWERHEPSIKIHHDVRAVFRSGNKQGEPAIVPPVLEKDMPQEFVQIWNEAKAVLSKTPVWIVCGYSLPDYDKALCAFFQEALHLRQATELIILDPDSSVVARRWMALATNCTALPLPGLPEALDVSWP